MYNSNSTISKSQLILSYSVNWILSNDKKLYQFQILAEKLYSLGEKLSLSSQCIFKAIQIMRQFLMNNSNEKYNSEELICQASVFLACKCEDNFRRSEDIYKYASEVFKFSINTQDMNIYRNELFDYEDILLSTLGFQMIFYDQYKFIVDTIAKIPYDILPKTKRYELIRIAHYLAKEIILFKSFCIKYTIDLISFFCIQLSIEIQNMKIQPTIWLNQSIIFKQVQKLIDEYSRIFIKCPHIFKERFTNERRLYERIYKITLARIASLKQECVPLALVDKQGLAHPCSSSDNIDKSNSSILPSTLLTPILSFDYSTFTKSPIDQSSQAKQPDNNDLPLVQDNLFIEINHSDDSLDCDSVRERSLVL